MQAVQREYGSTAITAFGRVASAVVSGRGRNETLELVAASARQLLHADLAAITLREPGPGVVAIDGLDAQSLTRVAIGPAAFAPFSIADHHGVITVARVVGGDVFDDDDVRVLRTLADQVAIVIDLDTQHRDAVDRDRLATELRVAADLQERAVSEVFSATLTLSQLANSLNDPKQQELIVRAIDTLDHAIKQIRQSALSLLEPPRAS